MASHDLQEPLRKILNFSERLSSKLEGSLDEKTTDYMDRIQNSASRMRKLLSSILEYSRLETSGEQFKLLDFKEMVAIIMQELEDYIKQNKAQINIEQTHADLFVYGDDIQLQQLLTNLVSNAIKYH